MNKIMPQRTFSPRSFMGDRGISIDNYGRVLKNDFFDDGKTIVAPKPWKPQHSKSLSNSKFVDENLFEEAGQEIQTIILHTLNMFEDPENADQFLSTLTATTTNNNISNNNNNNNLNSGNSTNNNTSTTTLSKPIAKSNSNNNNNNNNINIFLKKNIPNVVDNNNNSNTTSSNNNSNSYNAISSDNNISDSFTSISQTIGNIIENYTQESLIELKIPFFSHSPCFSADPIPLTPPTRTHNPITLNQAFVSTDGADPQQGAEIGLLSISPPLHFK